MRPLLILPLLIFSVLVTPAAHAASCEAELFGRIIAEPPIDDMGREFQHIFGRYLADHTASAGNLDRLATEIFELRLRLAQKYGTYFARMMEPRDAEGRPLKNWQRRFAGQEVGTRFSFGIKDHPRAGAIWTALRATLNEADARATEIDLDLFRTFGSSVKTNDLNALTWVYTYPTRAPTYLFPTFRTADGNYFMMHSRDQDVPALRHRARILWRRSLDQRRSVSSRVRALAEFEWVWFWTNPFGRSGALTGDALSILVQKTWLAQGLNISMRPTYVFADLMALSRPLGAYVALRQNQLRRTP